MRRHTLKTWPEYFRAVRSGAKRFELRRGDRGFNCGDVLDLREWDPETKEYTGAWLHRTVTYLIRDAPDFGLMPGFVIMGIRRERDP